MALGQSEAVLNPPLGLTTTAAVSDVSDGELLARFIAGRDELAESAFATLVRRHGPMVLRVCQQILGDRHTAEDVFQATFLILARRAGSIRRPELLGHWLHGVALRTAREARMRDVRRRRLEAAQAQSKSALPTDLAGRPDLPLVSREEFEVLHDEVSRLPERYRIPVVLCDLEGLTYQEAARRLCCPVGTIGVRLRRARERLRERLTRRGLAPTAGLLSAMLGVDAESGWASPVLVDSTVSAAMGFVASNAVASGAVSAPVISLSEAVLKTMALARLKSVIGITLTVGAAVTLGWVAMHREVRVPAAAAPAVQEVIGAASFAGNAAVPSQQSGQPGTEAPTAVNAIMSAPVVMAAISPGPAAPLVADAPKPLPVTEPTPTKEAISTVSPGQKQVPKAVVVPAEPRPRAREDLARGEMLFAKEWAPNDPMSHGGDGLGPVYNESSCMACHNLGAPGGAGPESKNVVLVTATPGGCGSPSSLDLIHPGFKGSRSTVLHRYGTDPEYASWRRRFASSEKAQTSKSGQDPVQARIRAIKERTSAERRLLERSRALIAANGVNLSVEERNTPPLFGLGQIDDIPSDVLVAVAAAQPERIRGRVSRTREGRIGKFGWKAQVPNLHAFVRAACANELGLEVPGHSQAVSPLAPSTKAKGFDLTEQECDALAAYVRSLPSPVVVDPFGSQGSVDMREGRRLFADVGCASCHVPSLGDVRGIYSDLLLHNMGQSLSDSAGTYGISNSQTPDGPTAREWRTPPLWGYRDSAPYMHDGRASDLEEAVALHDGQGRTSTRRFFLLSARERLQVEVFLKSLVAPTAAAAPGVMLAAEMERRIEPNDQREPEVVVRQRKDIAVPRDEQEWRQAQRRRLALEAAKRARRVQIPLAESLEKMGKTTGALNFYREIARQAAGTEEGRLAAERISALSTRIESP